MGVVVLYLCRSLCEVYVRGLEESWLVSEGLAGK